MLGVRQRPEGQGHLREVQLGGAQSLVGDHRGRRATSRICTSLAVLSDGPGFADLYSTSAVVGLLHVLVQDGLQRGNTSLTFCLLMRLSSDGSAQGMAMHMLLGCQISALTLFLVVRIALLDVLSTVP